MATNLSNGRVVFGNGSKTYYVVENNVYPTKEIATKNLTKIFKHESIAKKFISELKSFNYFNYITAMVQNGNKLSEVVNALNAAYNTDINISCELAVDISSLIFIQNEETKLPALIFSGDGKQDTIFTMKITPLNCKFKGTLSSPETEHSTAYEFTGTGYEELNNEFANITLIPILQNDVSLKIEYKVSEFEPSEYELISNIEITDVKPALIDGEITFDCSATKIFHGKENDPISITASGLIGDHTPVTIQLTCENASFNESETTKSFTVSSLEEINPKLENIVFTPSTDSGTVKIILTATNNEQTQIGNKEISLSIIKAGNLLMDQTLDNKISYINEWKTLGALTFTTNGDVSTADNWSIKLTPTNCKFKINEDDTEHDNVLDISATDLNDLNTKITNLSIYGTVAGDAKIEISMNCDGVESTDELNYTIKNKPNLSINDSSLNKTLITTIENQLGSLTLNGTIDEGDTVIFKVTPNQFTLKGLNSNATTEHTSEFTFEATSVDSFNTEFSQLVGKTDEITSPTLTFTYEIKYNNEIYFTLDEPISIQFSVVQQANLITSLTPIPLVKNVKSSGMPFTINGTSPEGHQIELTITPTNCMISKTNEEEQKSDPIILTGENVESLSSQITELYVTATEVSDCKIVSTIAVKTTNYTKSSTTNFEVTNTPQLGDITFTQNGSETLFTDSENQNIVFTAAGEIVNNLVPCNCEITCTNATMGGSISPSAASHTWSANSLEEINNELNNVEFTITGSSGNTVDVTISISNSESTKIANFEHSYNIKTLGNTTITIPELTDLKYGSEEQNTPIAITATGDMHDTTEAKVSIGITNGNVSGIVGQEGSSETYEFTINAINEIDTKLAAVVITPTVNTGNCKITINVTSNTFENKLMGTASKEGSIIDNSVA